MDQDTVIILAVCASVGGVAVLYMFSLWLRRRRQSIPLPPIQPLAHEREQHMIASHEPLVVSRHPSFFIETPDNSSARSEALTLTVPNPPFRTSASSPSPSSSSLDSAVSSESERTELRRHPTSPSRASSRRTSRLRPQSIVSSATSRRTAKSVGPPHTRTNQMQIILPAPLAPDVHRLMQGGPNIVSVSRKASLADKWTPSVHRSTESRALSVSSNPSTPAPPSPVPPLPCATPASWRYATFEGHPPSMSSSDHVSTTTTSSPQTQPNLSEKSNPQNES